MPETIACSPATLMLFRQFRGIGTVADGGREALEIQWNSAFPRKNAGALQKPAKSCGCVTYRKLRCNMTKGPHRVGVFADQRALREHTAAVLNPLRLSASPPLLLPCRNPQRASSLHPP